MIEDPVLAAFSDLCRGRICYFALVELSYAGRTKHVYACVGSCSLYFVKRNLARLLTGGELPLRLVRHVVVSERRVQAPSGRREKQEAVAGAVVPPALYIHLDGPAIAQFNEEAAREGTEPCRWEASLAPRLRCGDLDKLLKHLEVSWVADFMLRRGRLASFPVVFGEVQEIEEDEQEPPPPSVVPFLGTYLVRMLSAKLR